jgi:glycosyltransferase involved in cell wall biosynthesis
MLVNCPREGTYGRVRYAPWQRAERIRTDILVLNTSGGALDLRPILAIDVQARQRIVWVQGVPAPHGLHEVGMDFLCAPSNFIRGVAQRQWDVPAANTFVAYNAADGTRSWPGLAPRRDPYRLVYSSHPSKGLEAAIGVLRVLRQRDSRYHLHVYGGARLWGQEESAPPAEEGLVYHGLTGQARLARALSRAGISLNLQAREEPLPLAAIEAMRAGCVVLASPVGGYPEIITHGHNGFLVRGPHEDDATWRRAADLVTHLVDQPAHARYLRHNARNVPWDWETMARTWSGYWDWILGPPERARTLLEQVGLSDRLDHLPSALSGGEKQRAAIARAVIGKPELLLADEPTGNVDPVLALRLMRLLVEHNRFGTTVVIATPDTNLIAQVEAPVITLERGTLREFG